MKKLLATLGLLLISTTTQASECKWNWVIDVNNWYSSYQVPEARMIKLIQVLDSRYLVFDKRLIILDTVGSDIKSADYRQSLLSIMNQSGHKYIGQIKKVQAQNLQGFTVTKDLFEVVGVQEFYSKCRTKEERSRLQGKK
ncbi:hypothetical protein VPHK406_0042 [Vibrio phage K406]